MDRVIVYPGQIPLDTDFLVSQRQAQVGLGKSAEVVLGIEPIVDGFACTPTTPASMVVSVAPGVIYGLLPLEATSYGTLASDLAHNLVKQGVRLDPASLTITAPTTVGHAVNHVVQVALVESDEGAIVLPYYNATNPAQPFSGPNNSGAAQFTKRVCKAIVSLKPGVSAPAGTQSTPAVDPGYLPLYVITVAQGATTVTSPNITAHPEATFLPVKLPKVPAGVQDGRWIYAVDTGTANAMVAKLSPKLAGYTAGLGVRIRKGAGANTGPLTLALNGLEAKAVKWPTGFDLDANDAPANAVLDLVYDGTAFQVVSGASSIIFITTPITRTIFGGGDFASIAAAVAWLQRCVITTTGSVDFLLAAGKFTHNNSKVVIDHPNLNRVTFSGQPPTGPLQEATLAVTGVAQVADRTAQLAALRALYPTELEFTGSNGHIDVLGYQPILRRLLITSDRSATIAGLHLNNGAILSEVSVHGFGTAGIAVLNGTVKTTAKISVSGSLAMGIAVSDGAAIIPNADVLVSSCDLYGIATFGGKYRANAGISLVKGCGTGLIATNGGAQSHSSTGSKIDRCPIAIDAAHGSIQFLGTGLSITNAATYAVRNVQGQVTTQGATGSGQVLSQSGGITDHYGASGFTYSPAANTVGNGNAYNITGAAGGTITLYPGGGTYPVNAGTPGSGGPGALGGTGPYTFSITSGAFPPGISMASNGVISGTWSPAGTYTVTLRATDSLGAWGEATYTYIVAPAPTITISPPGGTYPVANGTAGSGGPTASGGTAPYTWSIVSGAFAPGISMASNGAISGTWSPPGTYTVTIRATDALGYYGEATYTYPVT